MGLLDSMKKELKEEIVKEVSEAILADIKELLNDSSTEQGETEKKEPQEAKNVSLEKTNQDYTELKSTVDELKEALLEVTTSFEKVDEMTVEDAYLSLLKE